MDVAKAITSRRSVQYFDPTHRMTDSEVEQLLQLVHLSPSSYNIQHCRYVVVRNRELRQKIRHASYDQPQVTEASLLVAICADLKAWDREPERYWSHAPVQVQQAMAEAIREAYSGDEQLERDEAMRSCGIAAMALMLAARDLGYDTCPMIGFEPDPVARLLHLPADHVVALCVAVGKPARRPRPRPPRLPFDEVVFENRFQP